MSKIKICNLKPGTCIINSLKLIIPGQSCVIRDESFADDPDLDELKSRGIISVSLLDEPVKMTSQDGDEKTKPETVAQPDGKNDGKKNKKNKKNAKKEIKTPNPNPSPNSGTDFRAVDGPEDSMGGRVVVMGESGPETKNMNRGINGVDGPKYAGDTSFDNDEKDDGFTTIVP